MKHFFVIWSENDPNCLLIIWTRFWQFERQKCEFVFNLVATISWVWSSDSPNSVSSSSWSSSSGVPKSMKFSKNHLNWSDFDGFERNFIDFYNFFWNLNFFFNPMVSCEPGASCHRFRFLWKRPETFQRPPKVTRQDPPHRQVRRQGLVQRNC